MEPLLQQHFYALAMFGLAAFMLGLVARALADYLLGQKRESEREMRDLLWREVELTIELAQVRDKIKNAPPEVRAGAFRLAFEQARRWTGGIRELAQKFGFDVEATSPMPPAEPERSEPAPSEPPPAVSWIGAVPVRKQNGAPLS